MKKSLVILGFASLVGSAFAQSFTESWDGLTQSATFTGASGVINADNAWSYQNVSPGGAGLTSWFEGNDTVFTPQAGAGYLGANFNNSTGSNAISNWLISKQVTFNNGDTIKFWARTVNTVAFPDRLHLKLSKSGASTNVADFSTVLVSVNPNLTTSGFPSTWTQFTGTVSGLAGATSGRFAFHYDVTNAGPSGANSDYIGIDSIGYTAVPEPATMAALGLGALALIRRRRAK